MMIIHYEVYVQEPRGWMLHARHPRQEREVALAEAKELEQLNLKVRIVRECYHTDSNAFEESDIYLTGKPLEERYRGDPPSGAQSRPSSPAKRPPPARKSPPRPSPARSTPPAKPSSPGSRSGSAAPPRRAAKRQPLPPAGPIMARLLPILVLAIGLAMGAVRVAPDVILMLWRWGLPVDLQKDFYDRLLLAIFVVTFLMVAVPLCLRFLPRTPRGPSRSATEAADPKTLALADQARELRQSLDRLAAEALAKEEASQWLTAAEKAEADAAGRDAEGGESPAPAGFDDDDLPDIRPEDDEAPPPKMEDPRQMEPEAPVAEAAPGPAAVSHRSTLMAFLGGAVNAVKSVAATLDNYNKFALHLYLAGAVEALCEVRKLGNNERIQLTTTALESLGTSRDLAQRFHGKLAEYLMEPQYMRMVLAGRNAMEEFAAGRESTAHGELQSAIKEWNRPTEKVKTSIITVMFTDMVGSTDMTQARGDAAAQEVVRRHNTIVRSAISQNGGREIKHTGDGIMASFASAAGAVAASVVIQRNVDSHNARMPEQALHLRIGLNAGEPIQEEDDLFGTTVQLAARVCAATDTDQILCTGVVKDLGLGKGATFRSAGQHALKGFRDKMELFEVVWRA